MPQTHRRQFSGESGCNQRRIVIGDLAAEKAQLAHAAPAMQAQWQPQQRAVLRVAEFKQTDLPALTLPQLRLPGMQPVERLETIRATILLRRPPAGFCGSKRSILLQGRSGRKTTCRIVQQSCKQIALHLIRHTGSPSRTTSSQ